MSSAPAQPAQDPKDTTDRKDTKQPQPQPQPFSVASWDPVNGAQVSSNDPTAKMCAAETMHIGSHPPAGSGNHVFAANTMAINTQTAVGRNAAHFLFGSGTSVGSTPSPSSFNKARVTLEIRDSQAFVAKGSKDPSSFMFGNGDSMFGGGAAPGHSVRWAYEKGAYEKVSHSVTGQLPPYFLVLQPTGFPPLVQSYCGFPIGKLHTCEGPSTIELHKSFGLSTIELHKSFGLSPLELHKPSGLSTSLSGDLLKCESDGDGANLEFGQEKDYVYFQNKASTIPKAIQILCKSPEDFGQDKVPLGKLTITTYADKKSDCRSHPIQNFEYCGIVSLKGIDRVEIRGVGMDKVKIVVYRNPGAATATASSATPGTAHVIAPKPTAASSSASSVAETTSS